MAQPTRRRFLKWGVASAAVIGGGAFVYQSVGKFGPPGPGLKLFDATEYAVLEAVCEAYFPGPPDYVLSAAEAGTAPYVDRYVGELYPDNQILLRALLRALNLSTVVTHGRTFRFLSVADRYDVLEAWADSSLRFRRAGQQSLSLFVKMAYFENPKVRAAAELVEGCPVSQEGRPQGV